MMETLSQRVLWYGKDEPLPQTVSLRAGALTTLFDHGTLRYIKCGETEVVRMIYAAVRDQNWGTIPYTLSDLKIDDQGDSFQITFRCHHQQREIDFVWDGTITGTADGVITFGFDGTAQTTFRRNRLGCCVLHPAASGTPITVEHVDGTSEQGELPRTINPHQPYFDIRAITTHLRDDLSIEVRMEGDTYEMEDQRNWTDASFKTYCTPLGLPFPVTVQAGERVRHTITVRAHGNATPAPTNPAAVIRLDIGSQSAPLPSLGVNLNDQPLGETAIQRLRTLHLAHVRLDLYLGQVGWYDKLERATDLAWRLDADLEMAVHLTDDAEAELSALKGMMARLRPPVERWLIFHEREKSTSADWVVLAREQLADYGAPIGAGTNYFFTELNRQPPPIDEIDLATYSVNPQVHAFDNASLVETLPMLALTAENARRISGNKPIAVNAVTLKMRNNPDATGLSAPTPTGELPSAVDPRQMSLFGAGWTLGAVKYLALGGAASATLYETMGWLGVMETDAGSPVPEKFASIAGGVFPLYHVLADVGEFAGGEVMALDSADPLRVDGMKLVKDGRARLLVANFTDQPVLVEITGVAGAYHQRTLDDTNAAAAMREPETWRGQTQQQLIQAAAGRLNVRLAPFAVICLDEVTA